MKRPKSFPRCLGRGPGALSNAEFGMWSSEYFYEFFIPQSAFRNKDGPLIEGELSFVGVIHDQRGGEGREFDQLA
jgi:hypothetical protein